MKINDSAMAYPMLVSEKNWWERQKYNLSDKQVKSVAILNYFDKQKFPQINKCWDASDRGDGSVNVYFADDEGKVIISGNGSGKIRSGYSMHRMFAEFTSLERIEGLELLDTGCVTDMSYLFYHCASLRTLDLSSWEVSRVTNFRGTFSCGYNQIGNASLKKLNLSGWDVSKAEDMAYMFYGCGRLKRIDVSNWNTSAVTNFRHTFADCFKLQKLDINRWNTGSVITFDGIFNDCRSLRKIDISEWDTSNCQEFDQMFDNCISLRRIAGIEKLDTSRGFSFEEMFFNCKSLRELNLSSIDTRKVDGHEFTAYQSSIQAASNMKKMIVGCNRLKKLVIGNSLVFYSQFDENSAILKGLSEAGYLVLSPETRSMTPFLSPKKDHAVFRPRNKYQKNDVVLYHSINNDRLIMHRIERPIAEGFLIKGDNASYSEYVPVQNIFAAAIEIHRGNKILKKDSIRYKALSFWSVSYNRLLYPYRNSSCLIWKAARKFKRALGNKKR